MKLKNVAMFACIIMSATVLSCKLFRSEKANDKSSALIGKWKFKTLDTTAVDSSNGAFVLALALVTSDSSSLMLDFQKDSTLYSYTSKNGVNSDTDKVVYSTGAGDTLFAKGSKDTTRQILHYSLQDSTLNLTYTKGAKIIFSKQ